MPRQFNFRRDFPQLNRETKTHEEILQEITVDEINDLLDEAFMECIVTVDEESVRYDEYYKRIHFTTNPLDGDDTGILKYFRKEHSNPTVIEGIIKVEGEAKPILKADFELRINGSYSSLPHAEYKKKYGAKFWDKFEG